MSDYFAPSRFARKPSAPRVGAAARPRGRTLAEALRDPAAVLRVTVQWDRTDRPAWTVHAWTDRYAPIPLDEAAQARLFTWLRDTWPAVNWWRPHVYDTRTGRLSAAPAVEDDGGIPELDHAFGEYRPPALADHTTPPLPFPAAEDERRAA